MFGIGFKELLLLIGVLLVVWYGARFMRRFETHRAQRAAMHDRRRKAKTKRAPAVEEMTECAVCGTYLAAGASPPCARPDCPYRAGS